MKGSRFWLCILGAAAALCVGAIVLMNRTAAPGGTAQILQDGQLLYTLALDTPRTLTVTAPSGGSNTITVAGGQICVSHASCPDQVCVKQGWVSRNVIPIVCLPNQLVIQIKGGESDLDAATG
jgi:hypothetical protein